MDGGWWSAAMVGLGGFGLGVGLVVGAYVARQLHRVMRDEGFHPDK